MPIVEMRHARDVMRAAGPTVTPTDRLSQGLERMRTFGVRELPVVENGTVVGILARSDLDPYVGQLEWTPVRMAMTAKPTTVSSDATIAAVAKALIQGAFNGVPVVAGSAFAGMVSRHDLLHILLDWPGDAEG